MGGSEWYFSAIAHSLLQSSSPRNIHLNPSFSFFSPEEESNGETQRWAHHSSLPPSSHVSYDLARNQPTVALPRKTMVALPVATAAAVISAEDTLDSDTFTLIPFRPSFLSFLPPL